jgi:DNA-binding NtrC family response regulator
MKTDQKDPTPEVMDKLMNYSWKGNVRELENVIERAMILCEGKTITHDHLRLNPSAPSATLLHSIPLNGTLDETAKAALKEAESQRIRKALKETGGNKSRAAELLKVAYKTLLTKIKDYGIDK